MPNTIAPKGFIPTKYLNSAAWNGSGNMYYIPSTDGSIMSPGDAVKSAAVSDAYGICGIQKALGTDVVRGVIIGFFPASPYPTSLVGTLLDLTLQNIPAVKTRAYYALVADDPDTLFEVQDDGLAALTATAVNKNATFTVANPTTPAQNSASVLSTASVATTAGLNLRIFGLVQRDDNNFGINAKWLVKFNQHELAGNTAGI